MKNKTKIILLSATVIGFLLLSNFASLSFVKINSKVSIVNFSKPTLDSQKTKETFSEPYQIVFHGLSGADDSEINPNNYIIDVYIEEKTSMGLFRFMPIYKPISINSTGNYKWGNPNGVSESENYEMSGHLNIFGTCSIKDAKVKTSNFISTSIQNQIKRDIAKKLNGKLKN